jgi:hypothetical protein
VTIASYRRALPPLVALAALALAACSGGGQDAASPAASPSLSSSIGAAPAPVVRDANAGRSLTAVDPCSLVTQVTSKIVLTKVKLGALPGTRACHWAASALDADLTGSRYSVGILIYDHAGLSRLSALPKSEVKVTAYPALSGHQARLVKDPGTAQCTVSIGVTGSSRVDVAVYGSSLTANCAGATEVAPLVAGQLPGGTGSGGSAQPPGGGGAPSGPLATVDPCSLTAKVTVKLTRLKSGQGYCQWVYSSSKNIRTAQIEQVEVDLVYTAGLGGIASSPSITMTPYPALDGHQARQAIEASLNTCLISVGVSGSSRVDVGVDDYLGSAVGACTLARRVAPMIAQQLPAGS